MVWIVLIDAHRLKYIFKFILGRFLMLTLTVCLFNHLAFSQTDSVSREEVHPPDEQVIATDTVPEELKVPPKFFSGVEIILDYGKILTLPTKFENKYEGGINLRFYEKIVFAGEFGYAKIDPLKAYDNALYYTVEGTYLRIGLDYYLALDAKNFFYGGVRYGMSQFEDRGQFLIDSEFWEDFQDEFGSTDLSATWYELVFGTETILQIGKPDSKIHINKLFLGWKFRLRILGNFENREPPGIYTIPGYGRTFDKTIPALNLYLKYRFGK